MTDTKEIALKIEKAWEEKDEAALRKHLHPDYISQDPKMTVKGIEATIEKMRNFTCKGDLETRNCISDGNRHVFEGIWHVTSPKKVDIPYISVMTFEGSKLKEKTIYFDPAKLPSLD